MCASLKLWKRRRAIQIIYLTAAQLSNQTQMRTTVNEKEWPVLVICCCGQYWSSVVVVRPLSNLLRLKTILRNACLRSTNRFSYILATFYGSDYYRHAVCITVSVLPCCVRVCYGICLFARVDLCVYLSVRLLINKYVSAPSFSRALSICPIHPSTIRPSASLSLTLSLALSLCFSVCLSIYLSRPVFVTALSIYLGLSI